MATRVRLDQVVRTATLVASADEEIGLCKNGGTESALGTIPVSKSLEQTTISLKVDSLIAIAHIPCECSRNVTIPLNRKEWPVVLADWVVRPVLGIGIPDGFELAFDELARDEILLKLDVQIAGRKSFQAQLSSDVRFPDHQFLP
jgi:hypothetical protein